MSKKQDRAPIRLDELPRRTYNSQTRQDETPSGQDFSSAMHKDTPNRRFRPSARHDETPSGQDFSSAMRDEPTKRRFRPSVKRSDTPSFYDGFSPADDRAPEFYDKAPSADDRAPGSYDSFSPMGDSAPGSYDSFSPMGDRAPGSYDSFSPMGDRAPEFYDKAPSAGDRAPGFYDRASSADDDFPEEDDILSESRYTGRGVREEIGAFGTSLWKRYLKFYRRNRIRGIGAVGFALIFPISMVIAFRGSRINYAEVIASWFKSDSKEMVDVTEVSSEEPESGFNVIVKFTYGTICSEPNFKKKVQNTVTKGQKFEVLETSGDFYRIEYLQNRFGWIDKYYVEKEGKEEPKVIDPHNPEELTGKTATALKKICQDYSAMGVGVAVIKDGKVSYTYCYGYANKSQRKKINSDTKFRPASLSKIISTLSTMTLVDAGRIDLDRNVEDYFGYRFRNPLFPEVEITPRMLLNHSSSLADEYIIYTGSNAGTRLKDLVVDLKSYNNQKPGQEFSYSNSGFGIVGSLDEVVTNMHYIYFTDSVLFDRLGLDAAFGGQSLNDKNNVAECYKVGKIARSRGVLVKDRQIRAPGDTYILAQGSLLISPKDYAKLVTIFINDGMYGNIRVLSEKAVKEVEKEYMKDDKFRYCLGFKKSTNYVPGHDMYYHGGNAYGVYASVCYDEKQKSGVVVMTSGAWGTFDDNHFYTVCQKITQQCYADLIDN